MFWYCKDIQQWLKPALKQGPDRYNEWVRKEFKTWSATFRHAINEPAADSLCDAFIPSRDSFISKQKEIHKQTWAQPVEGIEGKHFLEEFAMSTMATLWWLYYLGRAKKDVGIQALDVIKWLFDLSFADGSYVVLLDASVLAKDGDPSPENIGLSATSFFLEVRHANVCSVQPMADKHDWAERAFKRIL